MNTLWLTLRETAKLAGSQRKLWVPFALTAFVEALFLVFISGMGASRLLLRAHWALDVMSGFALGGFWLAQFLLVRHGRWCGLADRPGLDGPPEGTPAAA